jgi:hypothetical protein
MLNPVADCLKWCRLADSQIIDENVRHTAKLLQRGFVNISDDYTAALLRKKTGGDPSDAVCSGG